MLSPDSSQPSSSEPIHPWRWRALAVWIIVFTLVVFWAVRTNRELAHKASQARTALCAYKQDARARIRASTQYLATHPNGAPGIPRSVILNGIITQQKTLKSFDTLNCDVDSK